MAKFQSDYFCNLILNGLYNAASFDSALPATIYAQIYTVAPTSAGGGTQWADAGISRVAKARNTTNFPTATAKVITNASTLPFGTPVAGATIVGIGWFDASSGGNLLVYGDFDSARPVTAGTPFTLPVGAMSGTEE
jgi:hypothetical protein